MPVLFIGLGANSIWDANEAFYVETPRQMVLTGDYLNPSFGGEPRFNKPVLSYWLVAGAYKVLGESVATERAVIAIAALGILLSAVLIGRSLGDEVTGVLAGLLLVTAPRFVFFSRRILIDVLITMFMSVALAAFVAAERYVRQRRFLLVVMYIAIGGGVLTKGPVAVALPGLALVLWLMSERRLRDIRRLSLGVGAAIVLAIVLPWYVGIYRAHGWEYIRQFFLRENLERFASPITPARSVLFFIPVLLGDILMPWAPLIAVPLLSGWRRDEPAKDADPAPALRRLLWWWVVVIVVAFSLSASKEDLYILPAIPAAAVLVADAFVRYHWGESHRGVSWTLVAICVLAIVAAWMITDLFVRGYYALPGAAALAALLALGGILGIGTLWRRRFQEAVVTLVCAFVLFNYVFVIFTLPSLERFKPVPALAEIMNGRASADAKLAFLNMDLPSMVYYTKRPVTKFVDVSRAAEFMREHAEVWMLAGAPDWEELRARVNDACVAGRRPLFVAKASDIFSSQPPPDVLLLTRGRGCLPH